MKPTLHVDVKATDLEDFAEHFEHAMQFMRLPLGAPDDAYYVADGEHELLGDVDTMLLIRGDQALPTSAKQGASALRVTRFQRDQAQILYHVVRHGGDLQGGVAVQCVIAATRYRRDQLKVVVLEWEGEGEGYAARLRRWLDLHWEDAVVTNGRTAPVPEHLSPLKGGRPRLEHNAWLEQQVLAGDDPQTLRAEYIARYEAARPENATDGDKAFRSALADIRRRQTSTRKG